MSSKVGIPGLAVPADPVLLLTHLFYKLDGVGLYKIARLLGHKDIKMTQRYAHHYPESLRDGVEVLDNFDTIQIKRA